jgi:hypothetical protein
MLLPHELSGPVAYWAVSVADRALATGSLNADAVVLIVSERDRIDRHFVEADGKRLACGLRRKRHVVTT